MTLYSFGDAARQLGIARYRLNYLLEQGVIPEPRQRVGGRRMFTTADIENARQILAERRRHEPSKSN